MRTPTGVEPTKLRPRMPAAVLAALIMMLFSAGAAASVSVVGYPIATRIVTTAGEGSASLQIPALAPAPDGSDAEWVVVSANHQDLIQITPSGTQTTVAKVAFRADNGPPVAYASVDADGYQWVLDNDQSVPEDTLYAVGAESSASPGPNAVATFDGYGQDMTLGPDGALYISDDAGNLIRCRITAKPSASCTRFPLSDNFDGGAYAVGAAGQLVWFTDAAGELGAVSPQGTLTGPFADPRAHAGALSPDPGTLVEAPNGLVYAAGGAESDPAGNDEIVAFSPGLPSSVAVLASGLSNVVALTIGPDGNVWFLDASAFNGAGAVGCLDLSTGSVIEYPLPAGVSLPPGVARIAAGPDLPDPNGDGEVFFSATTTPALGALGTGTAVVGEVSGIPFPTVAGSLEFQQLLEVSKHRAAVLTLTCSGPTNALCSGRLRLKLYAGSREPLDTVEYDLRGGETLTSSLRLSGAAFHALESASGRSVRARVIVRTRVGTVSGRRLTIVGPRS